MKAALRAAMLAAFGPVVDTANAKAPGPHIEAEVVSATENRVTVAVGPDKEHWYYRFHERGAAAHEITGVPLVFDGRAGMIRTANVFRIQGWRRGRSCGRRWTRSRVRRRMRWARCCGRR
ncbi:MAG: hypothetical protein IPK78_18080 [Rhodospirillales bacterium]|nr:hypothetical protein [Rhodospirillales bacterium]